MTYHFCRCEASGERPPEMCPAHGFSLCAGAGSVDDVCGTQMFTTVPTGFANYGVPHDSAASAVRRKAGATGRADEDYEEVPQRIVVDTTGGCILRWREGEPWPYRTEDEPDRQTTHYDFRGYAVVPREHYLELLALARKQGWREEGRGEAKAA